MPRASYDTLVYLSLEAKELKDFKDGEGGMAKGKAGKIKRMVTV